MENDRCEIFFFESQKINMFIVYGKVVVENDINIFIVLKF